MNKLVVGFVAMIVVSEFCFCSQDNQEWQKRGGVWGQQWYTKTECRADGSLKKINGIEHEGIIVPLMRVPSSEDSLFDQSDELLDTCSDEPKRRSILEPEISEEMLKRVENMKLEQPKYSPKYYEFLARQNVAKQFCGQSIDVAVDRVLDDRIPKKIVYHNVKQTNVTLRAGELNDYGFDDKSHS